MKDSSKTSDNKTLQADVVVIGGGGAGLAAAVTAAERETSSVIVLEKRGLGGNSALAIGMFAAESPVQRRAMIDCRRDDCFKTAMSWAHWRINPRIVRAFIDKSGNTIQWLEEKGLEFDCFPFYPNQFPPTWHVPKGLGARLTKVLVEECKKLRVQLLTRTPAKRILTSATGEITGVLAVTKGKGLTITTNCVIIATGGYGGNKELLKKYCPDYRDNMEGGGIPHSGDGLAMATGIGAATEGLGILHMVGPYASTSMPLKLGVHPNIISIPLMAVAQEPYTIWVNKRGVRFADENTGYNIFEIANAVIRQPDNVCFTLLDQKMIQTITEQGLILGRYTLEQQRTKLTGLERQLKAQADKGRLKISDSWDEIAEWIGADHIVLKTTIEEYNAACDQGYDAIFAKERAFLVPLRTPPYYAIRCRADFHNTFGGIKINEHMEVLDKQDNPIPGLYAAGVDTGGWETETYCVALTGSAFGFAVNSGRIAGENAAKFVWENRGK
jgi:fumarate reductase flavoprotein subunit